MLSVLILMLLKTSPSYSQRDLETITQPEELRQYIYATAPSEDAFVAVQRLASPYIDNKNWDGAIKIFQKYQSWFPEMYDRFQKIIDLLKAPSQNLITTNINPVNTKGDEYLAWCDV